MYKNYPDLGKHMALQHYKIEISKMYAQEKWNCGLCPKPFATEAGLIFHLLTTHNALKEYLPRKESFALGSTKEKHVNKDETADQEDFVNKVLLCPICKAEFGDKKTLVRHMALLHFRYIVLFIS